jgi:hypothetical protein
MPDLAQLPKLRTQVLPKLRTQVLELEEQLGVGGCQRPQAALRSVDSTLLKALSSLSCFALATTFSVTLDAQQSPGSASRGSEATTTQPRRTLGSDRAVPMFDDLRPRADVIYLIANSSLVFGPDPSGRSEEITFVGPVTVPKWPMKNYGRRTLPDGREQIDIELTESDLIGESYVLGGPVYLGEHPDLRSLGTITESVESFRRVGHPAGENGQTAIAGRGGQAVTRSFRLTDELKAVIDRNPDILWDELISRDLRELMQQEKQIRSGALKPRFVAPVTATFRDQPFQLPSDVAEVFEKLDPETRNSWIHHAVQSLVSDLGTKDALVTARERIRPSVIPNDFVVARKVLITTAKGVLYNETPVPVRGKLDSIPPVFRAEGVRDVNVFRGMELPVPLLDKDKNVDGWFYSKAHMAYAVRPTAIERGTVEATVQLRLGERLETVTLRGPMEVHHGNTQADAHGGNRETLIEVMVLALRGRSELLGGDIMAIESFDDRDKFSQGRVAWRTNVDGESTYDLFLDFYTPSGKVSNYDPIAIAGRVTGFAAAGALEKGALKIPFVESRGEFAMVAGRPISLLNEAEKPIVSLERLTFVVAPRNPATSKF